MSNNIKRIVTTGAAMVAIVISLPASADYKLKWECMGEPVIWEEVKRMYRDICSMNEYWQHWAVDNANWQWGQMTNVMDARWWYDDNCHITDGGGYGYNQTARVPRSSIGGVNGRTHCHRSACVYPAIYAHYQECDVKLADDLSFAPIDESFWGWTNNAMGASILVHEYGHVLGLDDLSDNANNFNVMRGHTPQPWAGGNTTEPFPDEAAGIVAMYGGRWPGAIWGTNLFASAQFIDPLGSGQIATDEMKTFPVCRGSRFTVRVSIGNNGSYDVTSGLRLYMNNTGNPADPGVHLWYGVPTMIRWTTLTQPVTFTIPSNVAPGLYWFFWKIDSNSTATEWNESDNTVHCAMSVQVSAC